MSKRIGLHHLGLAFSASLFGLLLFSWTILTPYLIERELGITRADLLHKSQELPVIANVLEQLRVDRDADIDPTPHGVFRALEQKRTQDGAVLKVYNALTTTIVRMSTVA